MNRILTGLRRMWPDFVEEIKFYAAFFALLAVAIGTLILFVTWLWFWGLAIWFVLMVLAILLNEAWDQGRED